MTVTDESHMEQSSYLEALRADVIAGLSSTPKVLPPKWFYDARGSDLFDQITRLEEYYPTRAEAAIFGEHAAAIADITGADTLVELGSGTSEKTRLLLSALRDAGSLRRFVPFDVDPAVLGDASAAIAESFPGVDIHAVVGDFERHLDVLPREGRRLIAFVGSTLGNFEPPQRAAFLAALRATMNPGDVFLLGTDLVKDTGRLLRAYDDAAGVTAAFNKNVLAVMNRELGADFDLDAFTHLSRWNEEFERVEMCLRAEREQQVSIPGAELSVAFEAGEIMRTEVSSKFRKDGIEAELAAAGLSMTQWWTDPAGDFGVSLSEIR